MKKQCHAHKKIIIEIFLPTKKDIESENISIAVVESRVRRRMMMDAVTKTFNKASRLLGRKNVFTDHLPTPPWIHTVPTQECDIVVIFPKDESKESLIWLLERLRTGTPGLVISVHHHESSGSDGFYITAPFLTLLKAAEEVSLPKALRQEYGGHLTEFVCAEVSCFKDSDDEGLFFTSQERQSLVLHQLYSLRATQQDVAGLPSAKLVEGEAVFPKCLSEGVISQVFPLHEIPKLEKLQKHWVQTFLSLQPIDDIYEYFGVKITMHFAWLRYYTMCLVVPTALGVIYWQLAALLITRQIISTFKKSTNPCVIEKLRFARSRFETMCPSEGNPTTRDEKDHMYNSSEQPEHSDGEKKETKCTGGKQSRKMKQAELESLLYKFGPANFLGRDVTYKTDGAFLEHLEKLLQLGYVSLFSSALPLAAATALLGNLVEISGDSFQICFLSQRPFGQRVSRIGFWQNAMEAIGIASILINCVLIGLSSQVQRMFPKLSADKKIIVIVAFEHALMAMRFMITYAVFNLPTWMATKVTQVEYHSQKAMLHSSSTEQQIQTVIGRFMVTPSAKEDQEPITPFKFPVDLETRENLSDFQTSVTSLPGLEKSNLGKKSLSQIKIRGSICSDFESFSPKFLRSSQDLQYPPRYSILGGIEGHGSRHKIASEGVPLSPNADQYNHHLTIDNHGGIEWIRNIDRSRARIRNIRDSNVVEKSVNVENDVHGNKNSDSVEQSVYQSVVCIPLAETVSSLDNHLLRSIQTWNTGHKNQKLQLSPENEVAYGRKKNDNLQQQSSLKQLTTQHLQIQDHYDKKRSSNNTEPSELYDSSHAFLCQDDGKLFEEDKEAKKTRIKQSLMKRARSVAIFSLKLKERRARDTEIKKKELEKEIRSQKHDRKVQPCVSGELSCIPIEMLISVDDIAAMDESKTNS
ncbi:uncharacterized protein LOC122849215 isoform X4 [Aphidius gifuensis]|uniref:uncharacterized protein LOC122849215 isoform X4 n=1 Tax=Aphidius gifuensis TaxID=684658 RepID=UPI001CDBB07A|nr:uncharacterized protein LOC122849215 isoform X4 [Aphidius gifuensis]